MQVIAVCELEKQILGESVIDRTQEFEELVRYFNRLNNVINAYRMETVQPEDIRFLQEKKVSEIAIEASVRLFCTEEEELERIVEEIKQDVIKQNMK